MNLVIKDESQDEEEEENIEEEKILSLEDEWIFRAIFKIRKIAKFEVPQFSESLT